VYISPVADEPQPGGILSLESFIARVREGDSTAFEEIVRRYEGLILRVARRMTGNREDALDVAQDTFLRVYRSLGSFRFGRKFESWLYAIVVNVAYDHLRRRGALSLVPLEAAGDERSERWQGRELSTPEGEAERAQFREKLDGLLAELSPRLRAVFVLRDVEGLDTCEVASILGCRDVTVRRHSMEAREKLRGLLNRRFPSLSP